MNIVELYNPQNASNLSIEEVEAMQHLSDDEIKLLAKAYPNQATKNAYLKYYVTSEKNEQQRYPRGTWQNLYNLRKMNRKDIVAIGFVGSIAPVISVPLVSKVSKTTVVDLKSVDNLEGLKKAKNKELFKSFSEAEEALQQVIDAKAHHMTIKNLKNKVEEARKAAYNE